MSTVCFERPPIVRNYLRIRSRFCTFEVDNYGRTEELGRTDGGEKCTQQEDYSESDFRKHIRTPSGPLR